MFTYFLSCTYITWKSITCYLLKCIDCKKCVCFCHLAYVEELNRHQTEVRDWSFFTFIFTFLCYRRCDNHIEFCSYKLSYVKWVTVNTLIHSVRTPMTWTMQQWLFIQKTQETKGLHQREKLNQTLFILPPDRLMRHLKLQLEVEPMILLLIHWRVLKLC